jgi:hypothetical protein
MLFDLRGRGRRRTVQLIYVGLAVLMGGGLVLFGIGGSVSGGLVDALNDNSGTASGNEALERTVTTAKAATLADPADAAAWARLAKARFQLAGTGDGYDQATGVFTAKGKERLRGAEQAWDHYVALDPAKPDDSVASLMVQAFSPGGLNEPDKAVRAMEYVIQRRGRNMNLSAQLAVLAYQAGQARKGDLAADQAVRLAKPADRKLLRQNLESAKTQAASSAASTTPLPAATSTTDATSTTG